MLVESYIADTGGEATPGYCFSTSSCRGSLRAFADAFFEAEAGAGSFRPVSMNFVLILEKRNRSPLCSAKNCGSKTLK